MRKRIFLPVIFFLLINRLLAQDSLQLAPPQAGSAAVYFNQSTCISFEFRQAGAVIRYALSGEEPDENSAIYKEPICVSGSVIIKAKSFAPGFVPSSVVKVQCIKINTVIKSIEGSLPESPYDAGGLNILYDGKAGGNSFNSRWLGFRGDTLQWKIVFNKKQKPGKIHLGLMQAQASWIFYPVKIELISFGGKLLGLGLLNSEAEPAPEEKRIFSFPGHKKIRGLIIRINNFTAIPGWHPGKGNKPWLFIDEIAVE